MTTVADGHIPLWANSIAKQTDAGAVPGLNSISEAWITPAAVAAQGTLGNTDNDR